ncbi:MAG: DHA2 family efflux MFS transporter permease subunit [Candidatus Dormibacteria bacterium]
MNARATAPGSGARKWWALGGVMLAVLAVGLDATVLSVALPTLATQLHASESDLQWFSSGYLLVLAAVMLPAGLLGDRIGRKRVMLGALLLFGLASAGCALSKTPAEFLAARVVLGCAGAPLIVMAISALAVLFTPEERPKAVGIWAAVNFVAFPIGPILGGYILSHAWWGWVFLMNVPVALLGLVAVLVLVPESKSSERPGLDPIGVGMSTGGLLGLTYGLIQAGQDGWGSAAAIAPMVTGVGLLAAFLRWEVTLTRRPGGRPLIDLGLFRSRSFLWGILLLAVSGVAMVGAIFTLPQYFQGVTGVDPMGSGVRLLPLIVGLMLGALPAAGVTRLIGPKLVIALGFAVMGIAGLLGATTTLSTGSGFTAVWMAVLGLGLGLVFAPAASAALARIDAERSGVASGVLQAVNKVGGPLGAAVFGSALSSVYQARLPLAGLPDATIAVMKSGLSQGLAVAHLLGSPTLTRGVQDAFVRGMDAALLVSAGIAALGLLLTLAFMPLRAATLTSSPDAGAAETSGTGSLPPVAEPGAVVVPTSS